MSVDLKPKTVRDVLVILKQILKYTNDKYNANIKLSNIKLPEIEQEPLLILNKEEKEKLEKYCMKDVDLKKLGILICLNTGLRIGEICALKFKDINL